MENKYNCDAYDSGYCYRLARLLTDEEDDMCEDCCAQAKLRDKKGKNMKYYRLGIYMQIEYEYTQEETHFFKTAQEAEDFKNEYDKNNKRGGSYIPNIDFIEYDIDEVSYEEMKEEITVSEFERMFDIVITEDFKR